MPGDAEVFVVLDCTGEDAFIRILDDPQHPQRDGHMQWFNHEGTYWRWSRRIA
jgi:hypothetical protein